MIRNDSQYQNYLAILKEELVPAMGCTEPIAIAFTAATASELLGAEVERMDVRVSGNMLKNAKSVVVPGTNGGKGIPTAAAAGIVVNDPSKRLEILSGLDDEQREMIERWVNSGRITVESTSGVGKLFIDVTLSGGGHTSRAVVADKHTNVVIMEKDGKTIMHKDQSAPDASGIDRSCLNIRDIVEFIGVLDVDDVREIVKRQIEFNRAISREGLKGSWGSGIGSLLESYMGDGVSVRARAAAAAGSDARMNGCELPVVIVSGSGNQGITACMPVVIFAEDMGADEDTTIKAVTLSDLVTIHQKTGIGRLSAFCGVTSAGCGAGAGIAWLKGEGYEGISHTIINTLGIVSGMVCDGAKSSCAAKISESVDAAILGYHMFKSGKNFHGGDGVLDDDVEKTIANIGIVARRGMQETDRVIVDTMLHTK